MNRHLGTRMDRQIRRNALCCPRHAHILQDCGVNANIVKIAEIVPQRRHFRVIDQRIHRYKNPDAEQMSLPDRLGQFLEGKVRSVLSRSELLPAKINCIRTAFQRSRKSFPVSGRGQ